MHTQTYTIHIKKVIYLPLHTLGVMVKTTFSLNHRPMHFDITAANDEFLQIHRHDQILLDFGAALKPHLLLSN